MANFHVLFRTCGLERHPVQDVTKSYVLLNSYIKTLVNPRSGVRIFRGRWHKSRRNVFPTTDSCAATPSRAWSLVKTTAATPNRAGCTWLRSNCFQEREFWISPEPGCINLEMILGQYERSSKQKQNKNIYRLP